MRELRPFTALLFGLRLCFFNSAVRKLAIWPWLVGIVVYFAGAYGAIRLHGTILHWIVNDPAHWWSYPIYYLAWVGVGFLLLLSASVLSVVLVLVFTAAFQTSIAESVLREQAVVLQGGNETVLSEVARSVLVEAQKLLCLLPLMMFAFLISFIPFIAPVAIVCGAWLLAFQFVDITLDIFRLSAKERFSFARSHFLPLVLFGLVLTVFWAIPFVGIFLAPAATAGAAWFLSDPGTIKEIELRRTR